MRGISVTGAVAGGAWIALQGLTAAHRAGAGLPRSSLVAAAAVASGLAVAAAVRTASTAWRGPFIVPLPQHDLAVCCPAEAEAIRSAAALRGTMGGAGHVHPGRLTVPTAAWAAVAVASLAGPEAPDVVPWAAIAAACAAAAILLPARPFFYREAAGGRVVLHPASVRAELLRSSHGGAEVTGTRGAP